MVVPGFMAGDASVTRMAAWLRDGGFQPVLSGVSGNADCLEPTVARLRDRLASAVDLHGRPALTAPFLDGVRFVSLYSRSDEVVRWQACLDPAATQLEVDSSHIGMAFDRGVWTTIAAALG